MNWPLLCLALFILWALTGFLVWVCPARFRKYYPNEEMLHGVYIKCKDCKLEHIVYPSGKYHALRPIPKNEEQPN